VTGGPSGRQEPPIGDYGFLSRSVPAALRADVTIVEVAPRPLGREDPRIGELVGDHLARDGVQVHTAVTPKPVRRAGQETVLELEDGW
jgi:pyruvate/2-oxoglutarate dehydrogenase complex dihydrolipoamide dehydrogenase (E3) component